MLVLTRKPGTSVVIGDWEVIVSVVKVMNDGSVRLGFTAPPTTEIQRENIKRAIDANAGRPEHPPVFPEKREADQR